MELVCLRQMGPALHAACTLHQHCYSTSAGSELIMTHLSPGVRAGARTKPQQTSFYDGQAPWARPQAAHRGLQMLRHSPGS